MVGITRIPLDMVGTERTSGTVVASGQGLRVEQNTKIATELDGIFDATQGIFTLSIPGFPVLNISGFMTTSDVGTGRQGPSGRDGQVGIDGLIGDEGNKGTQGCRGPEGPQGRQGERGPRGLKGDQGDQGPQGIQGNDGRDGRVLIFIQSEDPGPVGAGSLWIRP